MDLKQALRLTNCSQLAFVGAGGKTTAIFQLAREYHTPVIVSASTHLATNQIKLADHHIILNDLDDTRFLLDTPFSGVVLLTGQFENDRTKGLSPELLNWLHQYCRDRSLPLLIEADGSRQLSLKAPAEHEPAILEYVDTVVVVAGLSGLGKPLTQKFVHRPEVFSKLSNLPLGEVIDSQSLMRVLTHSLGGLKRIPPHARRIVLLNQADTSKIQEKALRLTHQLQREYDAVVISMLQQPSGTNPILSVHEPTAGIILAAGEARRFGGPKQFLPWNGKPLIWHSARKALDAGLSPVFVVIGAYARKAKAILADLPVDVVFNPDWKKGQGSSVSVGVKALPPKSGAAIFLLADQPKIPLPLIQKLIESHKQTLSPIVAPRVQGQQANPVLFDRSVFTDLANLEGHAGGRQLFSSYRTTWVEWDDPEVFGDIDTPTDYGKLKDS